MRHECTYILYLDHIMILYDHYYDRIDNWLNIYQNIKYYILDAGLTKSFNIIHILDKITSQLMQRYLFYSLYLKFYFKADFGI